MQSVGGFAMTSGSSRPGRTCPAGYGYASAAGVAEPVLESECVYVVGGLYGNPFALDRVLPMAAEEPGGATVVFNGDFNWFNVEPAAFSRIDERVLEQHAIRGNVETEFARDGEISDCGCGYPNDVSDAEVARSNAIIGLLSRTAPGTRDARCGGGLESRRTVQPHSSHLRSVDQRHADNRARHADYCKHAKRLAKHGVRDQCRCHRREIKQTRHTSRRATLQEHMEEGDGAQREHDNQPEQSEHELAAPDHIPRLGEQRRRS